MNKRIFLSFCVTFCLISNALNGSFSQAKVGLPDDHNLLLGNPSGAVKSSAYLSNYLMDKEAFSLSYNSKKCTPNWVSWHLDSDDLGVAKRSNNFRPDLGLPENWYRATSSSYKNSGFDRGHNCPSADRTSSTELNSSTFLMTNIIPQAPNNNQGVWVNLEEYCRNLVRAGNELYIIMGSYGEGGIGSSGFRKSIDNDRISVPSRIWKVILVLKDGVNDLKRISKNSTIIAVDVPNNNNSSANWKEFTTTIDRIEKLTGYNLLNDLPVELQNSLESIKY